MSSKCKIVILFSKQVILNCILKYILFYNSFTIKLSKYEFFFYNECEHFCCRINLKYRKIWAMNRKSIIIKLD